MRLSRPFSARLLLGHALRAYPRTATATSGGRRTLKRRTALGSALILLAVVFVAWDTRPAIAAVPTETPAQKAQRMKWWTDARFGMFIHWGPVSLKGTEIGWSRGRQVPIPVYDNLYKEFNPARFDARAYVALAKEIGVKYITLTTKHHDGFSMFATKLSDYNIMHTPFHRDITRELADECRRQGLRFCAYYSIIDWYHPDYLPRGAGDKRPAKDADFERYYAFMKGQLRELVENYHPAVLWFDGEWEDHWTVERGRDVYAMLRRLDPNLIVNNRLGKKRAFGQGGMTPAESTVGDFGTPEQETGRFYGDRSTYWESNMTICRQWAWKPDDRLKSLKECVDLLVTNAGYDGNFMLNVGPMPDGRIEPRQVERLREIGRWMQQNGDTIYGTRGGPFKPAKWGVSTCKDDRIFLHLLRWPDDGSITVPTVERKIVDSRRLPHGAMEMETNEQGIRLRVPAAGRQELDTTIELTLERVVTNGAEWKSGKPVALPEVVRPAVDAVMLFEPGENDWKYSHHQSLAAFKRRLFAIWSSSRRDEDSPGQRVMYAVRREAGQWSRPRILFEPDIQPDGRPRILTAGGFHPYQGTLVAYAGDYSIDRKSTRLLARTSTDGNTWSNVQDLHVPICPNHGPQSTASGRLIIAGNTAFPYTDDPAGLSGWKMTGIYPVAMEPFQDNPSTFWNVAKRMKWSANLCEGAFYQTNDNVLHMLLRATNLSKPVQNAGQWCLWETRSNDNGATWSTPAQTGFSNTDTKCHFGTLPDGRFYCVGNPVGAGRMPLVLSTSRDGLHFDRHFILGDKPYQKRFVGMQKGGHYGYPHSLVYEGSLYVIVSRQKEAVEVLRVSLSELVP